MYDLIREPEIYADYRPREKPKQILKAWKIDITSLAVKAQHKKRYLRIANGKYLKIDYLVLYNSERKIGYARAYANKITKEDIKKFIRDIGIDKDEIAHDKAGIFDFGVQYWTQKEKQKIEHIFGFKCTIYNKYKNGEITKAYQLINLYKEYFEKLNIQVI